MAISGQFITILYTYYYLNFIFNVNICYYFVALSAAINIALSSFHGNTERLSENKVTVILGFDVLQLGALLYFTGGLQNPFSVLFLAPVLISSVSLPAHRTIAITSLMMVCAAYLAGFHRPLPWYQGQHLDIPPFYTFGVFLSLLIGALFTSVYAYQVADEARKLSDALAATDLVLAREQHLTQLDGLAAAAAHELGTPLATIAVVINDLVKQKFAEPHVSDDIALIHQEIMRCRDIISKISSFKNDNNAILGKISLNQLIHTVADEYVGSGISIEFDIENSNEMPFCQKSPAILYGLENIVENALDFARLQIAIRTRWTDSFVTIQISDDGVGFPPDVLRRVGDPFLRSRHDSRSIKAEAGSGMGLGLFIAKTLLERTGAKVSVANAIAPMSGAIVTIRWPRQEFEHFEQQYLAE